MQKRKVKRRFVEFRWFWMGVLLLSAVLWGHGTVAFAKEQSSKDVKQEKSSSELSPVTIGKRIEEIRKRLKQAESTENKETAQRLGVSLSDLQERKARLQDIQTNYQRLLTALKKQESLQKEENVLREKMKVSEKGENSQKPPFSLSFYDSLLDQLGTLEQQKETANLAIDLAKKSLENTGERLNQAGKDVRRFKENLETVKEDSETVKLQWALENAELERELDQAMSNFQKLHLQNLSKELGLVELRADMARRNTLWVRANLHFDGADLDKQLDVLKNQVAKLQERYNKIIREQSGIEAAWLDAQKQASSASGETEIALSTAVLHVRGAWRETYQKVLEQTEDMLQLLVQQEQIWKYRYAIVKGGVEGKQLDTWEEETKARLKNIERKIRLLQRQQTDEQSQMVSLERKISDENLNKKIRSLVKEQMAALTKLAEQSIEYFSILLASKQLHQRFLDEIAIKHVQIPLSDKIMMLTGRLLSVWNFELWAIGEQSVTVKKLFSALLILVIGIIAVKYSIRLMRKRLLPRVSLEAGAAAAFEKIFYYFSILVIVLVALRMVNIPLTAFTFLGGAIAIGVGFGAQNLINNFISGFIIMAERPIKIGDLIEIEQNFAIVEEIGARCTRIRTGANVHILVPNSSFLEKNITNWTLSDKMVRAHVTAGVVYGSPVEEVERLLMKAAREHKRVLRDPEPFVLFNDFGNSALLFDVYFWLSMTRIMERRIIESDIRFSIDGLFRKAGIVIAFPQLDVHFDENTPLQLKMMDSGKEGLKK